MRRARKLANQVSRALDEDGTNARAVKAAEVFASEVVQTILHAEFERVNMRTNEGVEHLVRRARELVGSKTSLDGLEVIAHRGARGISIRFVPTLETFANARARVA